MKIFFTSSDILYKSVFIFIVMTEILCDRIKTIAFRTGFKSPALYAAEPD